MPEPNDEVLELVATVLSHTKGMTFVVRLGDGQTIEAVLPKRKAARMSGDVVGDIVLVQMLGVPKSPQIVDLAPRRYFKRYWGEDAGGACSGWGGATYYFDCGPDGYVVRQIQCFDNGNLLLHDSKNLEDVYGGVSDQPLDFEEFAPYEIEGSEFEASWKPSDAINVKADEPPPTPRFPCPYCGQGLASDKARQCFSCGMDWHDATNIVQRGDPNWNRFGLDPAKMYVVELLQDTDGARATHYREVDSEPSANAVLETLPASGQQFIDWGFYRYSEYLPLSDGRRFGFEAHGIWLTEEEIEFLESDKPGENDTPWENGIAPLLPPK